MEIIFFASLILKRSFIVCKMLQKSPFYSHDTQLNVMKEFVALHDFENKSLDAALRYD